MILPYFKRLTDKFRVLINIPVIIIQRIQGGNKNLGMLKDVQMGSGNSYLKSCSLQNR